MMTYSDYMNRPLRLKRKINHKVEDVRLKESACTGGAIEYKERVQVSVENGTEARYIRYIDAKRELNEMFDELQEVQDEVKAFMYGNLTPEEADVLEWKYIDGKSPQQIAQIIGTSYDATRARLSRIEKKLKKVYNS